MSGGSAVCRWCGRADTALRCARCGSDAVRAMVIGARRTAEELGRAFPGATGHHLAGESMVSAIDAARVWWWPRRGPNRRTGRVRRRAAAGQLGAAGPPGPAGGRGHPAAVAGGRGAGAVPRRRRRGGRGRGGGDPHGAGADPVGSGGARRRSNWTRAAEVGLPPSVHLAALDGSAAAVDALLSEAGLPGPVTGAVDVLGPVELPAGVRRPAGTDADVDVSPDARRGGSRSGLALAGALRRPPVCSAPAATTRPFACRSTRCT